MLKFNADYLLYKVIAHKPPGKDAEITESLNLFIKKTYLGDKVPKSQFYTAPTSLRKSKGPDFMPIRPSQATVFHKELEKEKENQRRRLLSSKVIRAMEIPSGIFIDNDENEKKSLTRDYYERFLVQVAVAVFDGAADNITYGATESTIEKLKMELNAKRKDIKKELKKIIKKDDGSLKLIFGKEKNSTGAPKESEYLKRIIAKIDALTEETKQTTKAEVKMINDEKEDKRKDQIKAIIMKKFLQECKENKLQEKFQETFGNLYSGQKRMAKEALVNRVKNEIEKRTNTKNDEDTAKKKLDDRAKREDFLDKYLLEPYYSNSMWEFMDKEILSGTVFNEISSYQPPKGGSELTKLIDKKIKEKYPIFKERLLEREGQTAYKNIIDQLSNESKSEGTGPRKGGVENKLVSKVLTKFSDFQKILTDFIKNSIKNKGDSVSFSFHLKIPLVVVPLTIHISLDGSVVNDSGTFFDAEKSDIDNDIFGISIGAGIRVTFSILESLSVGIGLGLSWDFEAKGVKNLFLLLSNQAKKEAIKQDPDAKEGFETGSGGVKSSGDNNEQEHESIWDDAQKTIGLNVNAGADLDLGFIGLAAEAGADWVDVQDLDTIPEIVTKRSNSRYLAAILSIGGVSAGIAFESTTTTTTRTSKLMERASGNFDSIFRKNDRQKSTGIIIPLEFTIPYINTGDEIFILPKPVTNMLSQNDSTLMEAIKRMLKEPGDSEEESISGKKSSTFGDAILFDEIHSSFRTAINELAIPTFGKVGNDQELNKFSDSNTYTLTLFFEKDDKGEIIYGFSLEKSADFSLDLGVMGFKAGKRRTLLSVTKTKNSKQIQTVSKDADIRRSALQKKRIRDMKRRFRRMKKRA